ncbi:MAG: nuclear transport factor 2 family protein [Deltaproteobacteria bacterium]|nr:nuclear transport factor 2 family protein [Deltaproteobacteria bacterium]
MVVRNWRCICACAAVALIASACGKDNAGPAPTQATQAAPTPTPEAEQAAAGTEAEQPAAAKATADEKKAAAETPDAAAAAPAPVPLQEAVVLALLQRWLQAQNAGDFEAYEMLYAERFQGIKRSGHRQRAFARKGWLADRKRMFGKAMKVIANGTEVHSGVGVATVTFEQDWQSGSYRDVGPKQLVVVQEGTELRIAREEMLASEVKGADVAKPLDAADFSFVSLDGGAPYVLLAKGKAGMKARGPLRLLEAGHYASAARRILEADVAEAYKPWIGRAVTLYGDKGTQCHGEVVQLVHLARVQPHFGTYQSWTGEMGSAPMKKEQIADDAWDLGQGGLFLAGRVVPAAGTDCRGAYWARADDRPRVTLLPQAAPDPMVLRAGLPKLRALRGWADVQKEYAEMVALPRAEQWDAYGEAKPKVVTFRGPGDVRYLYFAAQAGDGCGDFYGELWGLWELRGEGDAIKARLLSDDRSPGRMMQPRAAVDLDGDGTLEFIGKDALLQPAGPTWRIGVNAEVPSLDCPC